jgi:hypothetical protein
MLEGIKFDEGKPPLHLLPPDALYAITEILDHGQEIYGARNWEKGMAWSRVYRAAIGHMFQWFMFAGPDKDTGKSHLWHAGACILFLITYELRGIGTDDRPTLYRRTKVEQAPITKTEPTLEESAAEILAVTS